MSASLIDLSYKHVVGALDQQMALARWMDKNNAGSRFEYSAATTSLDLGGETPLNAFHLGTYNAKLKSWLWSWCDSELSLSAENLELATTVKRLGERLGLDCLLAEGQLSCKRLLGDDLAEVAPYAFAWSVGGELNFDACYLMPFEEGQFVLLIQDDQISVQPDTSNAGIRDSFVQVISAVPVLNHRATLEGYLQRLELDYSVRDDSVVLERDEGKLVATFNQKGRLISLDGDT